MSDDTKNENSNNGGNRRRNGGGGTRQSSKPPVKIAIPKESYAKDDRKSYWVGLVEECPLDFADVPLGQPADGTLEAYRAYRDGNEGCRRSVLLSYKKRTQVQARRGTTIEEIWTAGGIERMSDKELEMFHESLSRLGIECEHDDEGELKRAYAPRQIHVGDIPLAQFVFIEEVEEDINPNLIRLGNPTPAPLEVVES